MKKEFKARLLASVFAVLAVVGLANAARYVTNFSKIQLDQNAILDSTGTQRISVGSTNAITGNLTVSGTTSITGATTLKLATITITDAPSAAGLLGVDSSYVVYVATGTAAGAWVKVGGQ